MLIQCPECDEQISDTVNNCPHCGYSLHQYDGVDLTGNILQRNSKTVKLVVGIISIVLSLPLWFQSCSLSALSTIAKIEDPGFSVGVGLSIIFLVCGIINIARRKIIHSGFAISLIYVIFGCLAVANAEKYKDLAMWGIISLIFGLLTFASRKWKK